MSRVAELHIGPKIVSWNYEYPDVLSLMFKPEDYLTNVNESEGWREHKLVTTCGEAIEVLKEHNITLDTLRRLYFLYYRFNLSRYRIVLFNKCDGYLRAKYEKPIRYQFVERMANHIIGLFLEQLDDNQEFEKVVGAFRNWVIGSEVPSKPDMYEPKPLPSGKLLFVKKDWYRHSLVSFISEDPYSPFLGGDWRSSSDVTDLDDLYYLILPIFASDPELPLILDLTAIIDSAKELERGTLVSILATDRIYLLQRSREASSVFGGIKEIPTTSGENQTVGVSALELAAKAQGIEVKAEDPLTAKEKGDYLEDLAETIFAEQEGFEVKRKVRGQTDELDLVVINNVNRPFWTSIQSPLILVECKNWKDKSEPKHIRDFEIKIRDRTGLCRLGVFIAPGGYTSGCYAVAAKLGREEYKIILVDNAALKKRVDDQLSTAQWMEELILRQF